ncbi:MAG: transposase [Candidatus Thermoplasmatota archaeon]
MVGLTRFTPGEKVEIVLLGLKNTGSASELCRRHNINPNTYSRWKKHFANGWMDALKPGRKEHQGQLDRENQKLKQIVGELFVELEIVPNDHSCRLIDS